jgi:hypothetical protein
LWEALILNFDPNQKKIIFPFRRSRNSTFEHIALVEDLSTKAQRHKARKGILGHEGFEKWINYYF